MLAQRSRQWVKNSRALGQRLVFDRQLDKQRKRYDSFYTIVIYGERLNKR